MMEQFAPRLVVGNVIQHVRKGICDGLALFGRAGTARVGCDRPDGRQGGMCDAEIFGFRELRQRRDCGSAMRARGFPCFGPYVRIRVGDSR